jgi:DNA/RNA endonuclease G (NUC1)
MSCMAGAGTAAVQVLIPAFRGHVVERAWAGGNASFATTSAGALYHLSPRHHDHNQNSWVD